MYDHDYFKILTQNNTLVFGVSVLALYICYWLQRPKNFPPGPRGVPIFGYLPFLGRFPEQTAYELSRKYGSILSIRLGSQDFVFLNDFESTNSVFVKQGAKSSGRSTFRPLETLYKNVGILLLDYGKDYKSQKKFCLATLRGFGVGKKGMEVICQDELSYLAEKIQSFNEQPTDLSDLVRCAVSNNICSVVFGSRFEYNDISFKKHLKLILSTFSNPMIGLSVNLISFVPFMRFIPPFSYYHHQYLEAVKDFFVWINEIVEEHKRTFDENNFRDFIDAYLDEINKETDSSFTERQLSHVIADLFVAGSETTSSTLLWGLLCFIHYPEMQARIRKEVIDIIGSSGVISFSKKSEMPYTSAFLQELVRYRTLAPLTLPHEMTETVEVNQYVLPKGTLVFSNIKAVHNDPNLWKDPAIFNPERFLDEQGNFIKSNHVISFSVGPRRCLGEQLANMENFVFLVGLVQKFEFLPDPNAEKLPSIDEGVRSLTFASKPYKIVAKEYES